MTDVTLETVGKTRIVTIDRPEARNALTLPVLAALTQAFTDASGDDAVRCVVLTGAGGHFCAGADLRKNMEDPNLMERTDEYIGQFHGVIKGILACPKPVVAMMDGAAVGFGADMALACDLRVVSTAAYVQEKFVSIGLMPDGGGSFWLPRLVGTARAMQWILLAEKIEGPALAEHGIAVRAVPPSELRAATLEITKKLEGGPPLAHAAIKRSVYASWGSVAEALARERQEQLKLLHSADVMEGVLSWMQKREPQFQGR